MELTKCEHRVFTRVCGAADGAWMMVIVGCGGCVCVCGGGRDEVVMMRPDTSHMRPRDNAGDPSGVSSYLLTRTHTRVTRKCTSARNFSTTEKTEKRASNF